jgi:adenosylcobinamide-GDP ribazoletransferase
MSEARNRPLRDAGLAVSLLTVVPTPARWPHDGRTQVAAWFPWVGLVLGAIGGGLVALAAWAGVATRASYLLAAVVVALWALATRLLHWDGLADVADGFWGSDDLARRLEIMGDSHTGAFGATAIALVALLEVTALGTLAGEARVAAIAAAPALARFAATCAAWLGTPAREGGLGRSVLARPTGLSVFVAAIALGAAGALLWVDFGVPGLCVAGLGIALAFVVPHVVSRRFGGVTGDVMGASVLLCEAAVLCALGLIG